MKGEISFICFNLFLTLVSLLLLPKIGSLTDWDATTLDSEIEKVILAATGVK